MRAGNTLYYGDNLKVMRQHIGDASVDLVYLDPPFNSQRDYNVLFREQSGEPAQGQIKAFTDTWQWSERAYIEFCETCPLPALAELMQGFVRTLGRNDLTAYLVMMAPRLVELHRVLKPTGSLYLHCDPTASHYLKVMLDVIFGARNFRNEIVWKRTGAHGGAKRWGPIHDVLLFYSKTPDYTWNRVYEALDPDYIEKFYRFQDERGRYRLVTLTGAGTTKGDSGMPWKGVDPTQVGRHWAVPQPLVEQVVGRERAQQMSVQEKLDALEAAGYIVWPKKGRVPQYKRYLEMSAGNPIQDVITDIQPIGAHARERLGYPTQKPLALLERIIHASSNEGDVVLDPFCGCGTAIVAAQKLNRRWIGIDITHLAIALIKYRLSDMFDLKEGVDYRVIGEPTSVEDARALALQDRDEFQRWAIGLIPRAFPYQQKKGADTGIDGMLHFTDNPREHPKKVVIQVKSGRVGVKDIRDFRGVLEREGATLGLFVSLEPPTEPMLREAEQAGYYKTPLGDIALPRLQIRTVEQLLRGEGFAIPSAALLMGVAQAARAQPADEQNALDL
ncbi:MAG: restriction endonuclease subunit M [Fimbriimonadales bacterium]|nr:MAG: restriction endonuclease subunit M [Fimbriimonadales bacterium]